MYLITKPMITALVALSVSCGALADSLSTTHPETVEEAPQVATTTSADNTVSKTEPEAAPVPEVGLSEEAVLWVREGLSVVKSLLNDLQDKIKEEQRSRHEKEPEQPQEELAAGGG